MKRGVKLYLLWKLILFEQQKYLLHALEAYFQNLLNSRVATLGYSQDETFATNTPLPIIILYPPLK